MMKIDAKLTQVYKIHHQRGLKLLTQLRFVLSHLREHKFLYNFDDKINHFCLCGTNSLKTTEHALLMHLCTLKSLTISIILLLPFHMSLIVLIV